MISHHYKCIHIHIPKCAGTSIEMALGHFDNYQKRGRQDHRTIMEIEQSLITWDTTPLKERVQKLLKIGPYKNRPGTNPNNKLRVTSEQYHEYYKFAIIRNPWARAFSWYENIIRDEVYQKKYQVTSDFTFNVFLRKYAGKGSLRPQTDWLKSLDGTIKLDYVGRFENLREDFQQICSAMNVPHVGLPHELKGSGNGYMKHYDEESMGIIAATYQEEIEMFGFSFDSSEVSPTKSTKSHCE